MMEVVVLFGGGGFAGVPKWNTDEIIVAWKLSIVTIGKLRCFWTSAVVGIAAESVTPMVKRSKVVILIV